MLCGLTILFVACQNNTDPALLFQQGKYEQAYPIWLEQAKEKKAEAQYYLGIHHFFGLGVKPNHQEASKWYEQAAKSGHVQAQRSFGDMYYNGHGAQRDYYQAFIWYFAASQQGSDSASARLAQLSSENKLTPNQQMHAKLEANQFISDPELRFQSHDTYVKKKNKTPN